MPFDFNDECSSGFLKLKGALNSAPMIQAPEWELPFEGMSDIRDYALGAVVGQRRDSKLYVMYYVSHTLDKAQVNYAMMEKDFLTVVFTLKKLQSYLTNSKAIIFTDHAALKHLMKKCDSKPHLIQCYFPPIV